MAVRLAASCSWNAFVGSAGAWPRGGEVVRHESGVRTAYGKVDSLFLIT
jgi:hypothetical protein